MHPRLPLILKIALVIATFCATTALAQNSNPLTIIEEPLPVLDVGVEEALRKPVTAKTLLGIVARHCTK